jgi:hypothetical protein
MKKTQATKPVKKKKSSRGGARPGSGRKPGVETFAIGIRIPKTDYDELRAKFGKAFHQTCKDAILNLK